jgi:hypothetical protein
MQTEMPFFEGPEDALKEAVRALGGTKAVGPMLWPDKGPEASSRLLHDCLNTSRNEKLDISQVMLILAKAKDAGFHAPYLWLSNEVGYEAKPITKAQEVDRLTNVIERASKDLAHALAAMERVRAGA